MNLQMCILPIIYLCEILQYMQLTFLMFQICLRRTFACHRHQMCLSCDGIGSRRATISNCHQNSVWQNLNWTGSMYTKALLTIKVPLSANHWCIICCICAILSEPMYIEKWTPSDVAMTEWRWTYHHCCPTDPLDTKGLEFPAIRCSVLVLMVIGTNVPGYRTQPQMGRCTTYSTI